MAHTIYIRRRFKEIVTGGETSNDTKTVTLLLAPLIRISDRFTDTANSPSSVISYASNANSGDVDDKEIPDLTIDMSRTAILFSGPWTPEERSDFKDNAGKKWTLATLHLDSVEGTPNWAHIVLDAWDVLYPTFTPEEQEKAQNVLSDIPISDQAFKEMIISTLSAPLDSLLGGVTDDRYAIKHVFAHLEDYDRRVEQAASSR
ncbi:hypothetical protein M231_08027 [Tremella mesenterica]|uniref:Uncharacterized protein n=1 Tax=Tremella mesenterica TaxID=5217 RepID=A0A4Q1B7R8_TREME|nr:hypothetical protein M231_08027 [Tremella mesenterica]